MPVTRVGIQAVTGSTGQVVDIDPARISATISNVGSVAVEYSTNSGSSWTSIAASGSASVSTINTNELRLRRSTAGGYPTPVDIEWTAQSEGEANSLTAAQASSVSGDGTPQGATVTPVSQAVAKVFSDGVTSTTGPGVQLVQPDGTNAYMGATKAYGEAAKSCTVTWSAGNVASIAVTGGHGCVESDAFVLQVANEAADAKWAEVLRAATITDANTLTARLPFRPTAGPVGAVTFRRCTRNVTIDLDLDYNYAGNNTAGSNPNRMALVLAFLADSTVRVRGENVFKYLVLAAGCDNVHFDVGGMPNSRSDTFKLYGPSNNNTIKVFGQAGEDCVSLQALEPASFIGYMPCRGNIRNTRIRGISARTTDAGSAPVVVYSDPTYNVSGTTIEDGESWALAGAGAGLAIKAGAGFSPTSANLGDVTLRNMDIMSAADDCLTVRTPMRRLTLDNCTLRGPGDLLRRGLYLNNNVDVLEIANQTFDLADWVPGAGNAFMYNVAAIKTLAFRNCKFLGNASLRFFLMAGATASVDTVILDNCEGLTLDYLFRFESTMASSPTVIIRGGSYAGLLTIANFRKTGGRLILEGPTISGATNGVCRSEGASVITDVYGWANLATAAQLAVGVSGGLVNLRTPNMPFAHTAAVLNNADGNEFVTNVAGGTLTAGMPVIGNGTAWLCRRNFSLTS